MTNGEKKRRLENYAKYKADAYMHMQQNQDKESDDAKMKSRQILNAINQLEDDKERDVLMYRYIYGLDWSDISTRIFYSVRQTRYLRDKAIEKLEL